MERATRKGLPAYTPRLESRSWRCIVLLTALSLSLSISTSAQTALREPEQEAAYLRNILTFVEWSASAEGGAAQPLQLCVQGDTFLAFALVREFRAVSVDHRKVEVRSPDSERELTGCAVLVIGPLSRKKIARLLASAAEAQIMTFGETDGFLEAGGAVQITRKQDAFQFAVNLKATHRARVKLDARLLQMATRILDDTGRAGG